MLNVNKVVDAAQENHISSLFDCDEYCFTRINILKHVRGHSSETTHRYDHIRTNFSKQESVIGQQYDNDTVSIQLIT